MIFLSLSRGRRRVSLLRTTRLHSMRGNYSSIYSSIHPSVCKNKHIFWNAYDTEVDTGQTSAWFYKYFINNEWMSKMQSQASWYSAHWSVSLSHAYVYCLSSLELKTVQPEPWFVRRQRDTGGTVFIRELQSRCSDGYAKKHKGSPVDRWRNPVLHLSPYV